MKVQRALVGPLFLALAAGCADEGAEPVDTAEMAICNNNCEPPEPSPAPSPAPSPPPALPKPNLKATFDAVDCSPDSFTYRVTNVGEVAAGGFLVATMRNGWYSRFLQYQGLGVGESVTFTESFSYTTPGTFVVIADWNNYGVLESNEYDNEVGVQCL